MPGPCVLPDDLSPGARSFPAVALLDLKQFAEWQRAREWLVGAEGDAPQGTQTHKDVVLELAEAPCAKHALDGPARLYVTSAEAVQGPLRTLERRLQSYWDAKDSLAMYEGLREKKPGGPKAKKGPEAGRKLKEMRRRLRNWLLAIEDYYEKAIAMGMEQAA